MTLTRRGRTVAALAAAVALGAAGGLLAALVVTLVVALTVRDVHAATLAAIALLVLASLPRTVADRTWRTPTTKENR